MPGPVDFRGVRIGLPVCEDIWNDEVCECLEETGAELLLVPNGSPYWVNRAEERLQVVVSRVVETGLPLVYCYQVGGQGELVFGEQLLPREDLGIGFAIASLVCMARLG